MFDLDLLNKIINVWDPADLMDHAPSDEYLAYSKKLYGRIGNGYQIEMIRNAIIELNEEEFGYIDIPLRTCEYVAQLIWLLAKAQPRAEDERFQRLADRGIIQKASKEGKPTSQGSQ